MLRGSGVMAVVCATVVALAAPSAAAAARPSVFTGGVTGVSQTGVTFTGRVDANRRLTSYVFEYGTTTAYGSSTNPTPAGRSGLPVSVVAGVSGLAPFTRYHYRLVATNRDGVARGRDRTFRTRRVPLALSLEAAPNRVIAGRAITLRGTLSGSRNTGRSIRLQANPFPFLTGFNPVGNVQLTDATGAFSFPVLALPVTTQFQVYVARRPAIISPVIMVGAAVRVTTRVNRRRIVRGQSVRFSGRIFPARDGVLVAIQRRIRGGRWLTVKRATARRASRRYSRYARRVRIRRSGRFRVFVNSQGAYVGNDGRSIRIRVRRR
jgi:hypothetical protein